MAEIHQEMKREESGPSEVQNPDKRLLEEIRIRISSLGPPLSSECCIYRVPKSLRDINPAAYTPRVVSIGPFHYGDETLKKMENEKLRYLQHFLAMVETTVSLDELVSYIRREETRIRRCYAESTDYIWSDEFVQMVLVDAAFIIKLFTRSFRETRMDDSYLIFDNECLRYNIFKDLILLENQLPFFILQGLHDLAFNSYQEKHFPSFANLTLHFFCYYNQNQQYKDFPENTKHFTDLLRYFQLPRPSSSTNTSSTPNCFSNCCNRGRIFPIKVFHFIKPPTFFRLCHNKSRNKNEKSQLLYNAIELHEAGVKFEASQNNCMLHINFVNGKLVIPCFTLHDSTESFMRNLAALEQCHYPRDAKICSYILLMDYVINPDKDVELLIQKKIMVNWLGDNQTAANLVNKLATHIIDYGNHYRGIIRQLNEYYEVPYHSWKATLRHVYFSTPFRAASTIAAFILLVLTLLQTVFSGIAM